MIPNMEKRLDSDETARKLSLAAKHAPWIIGGSVVMAAIIIAVALFLTVGRDHVTTCDDWERAIDQTYVSGVGMTREQWKEIIRINGYVETDQGRVYEPAGGCP